IVSPGKGIVVRTGLPAIDGNIIFYIVISTISHTFLGIVSFVTGVAKYIQIEIKLFPIDTGIESIIDLRLRRSVCDPVVLINLSISVYIYNSEISRFCIREVRIGSHVSISLENAIGLVNEERTNGITNRSARCQESVVQTSIVKRLTNTDTLNPILVEGGITSQVVAEIVI